MERTYREVRQGNEQLVKTVSLEPISGTINVCVTKKCCPNVYILSNTIPAEKGFEVYDILVKTRCFINDLIIQETVLASTMFLCSHMVEATPACEIQHDSQIA